jgi:hypothetical protein
VVLAPFLALIVGEKLLAVRSTMTLASTNSATGPKAILLQHDGPVLFGVGAGFRQKFASAYAGALCATGMHISNQLGLHRSPFQPQFQCLLRYCGAKVCRTNSATTRTLAPIRFFGLYPQCNGIFLLPPPLSPHLNRSHHHNPQPTASSTHSLGVI